MSFLTDIKTIRDRARREIQDGPLRMTIHLIRIRPSRC